MKWNKNMESEKNDFLKKRLREYEAITEMTDVERNELREWVADGHDPFDNPWYIYEENGWPMGYIQAMHEVMWMCEGMKNETENLAVIYQDQVNEKTSGSEIGDLTSESLIL